MKRTNENVEGRGHTALRESFGIYDLRSKLQSTTFLNGSSHNRKGTPIKIYKTKQMYKIN